MPRKEGPVHLHPNCILLIVFTWLLLDLALLSATFNNSFKNIYVVKFYLTMTRPLNIVARL